MRIRKKKIIYLSSLIVLLFFSINNLFCQSIDSYLYPSELLISDKITFATLVDYQECYNVTDPIDFKIKQYSELTLQEILINSILDSSVKAYDLVEKDAYYPYNIFDTVNLKTLTIEEAKVKLGYFADTQFVETTDSILQIVVNPIVPKRYTTFDFIENWIIDNEKHSMIKNIKGIIPNYGSTRFFPIYMTPAFLIIPKNNKRVESIVHVCEITYEYFFDDFYTYSAQEFQNYFNITKGQFREEYLGGIYQINNILETVEFEKKTSPFWNSYVEQKFIDFICIPVLQGNHYAYDYKTENRLDTLEIKQRLGYQADSMWVENMFSGELEKKLIVKEINFEEIKSVIFIEDWYIDTTTLYMEKRVKSIAPVRYHIDYDDLYPTTMIKEIAFLVKLNKKIKKY